MSPRWGPRATTLQDRYARIGPLVTRPLVEEVTLPQEPSSLFPAFLDEPYPILLESSRLHPKLGRYSYITADPFLVIKSKGDKITLWEGGVERRWEGDVFLALKRLLSNYAVAPVEGLPPFQGGAAGYFGYDLCHQLESLPSRARDDLGLPHLCLGFYDWVLAWDHWQGRFWLLSTGLPTGDEREAWQRLRYWKSKIELSSNKAFRPGLEGRGRSSLRANFTRRDYLEAIERAKEYIAAGDIYQVNLSQRFQTELPMHPWQLYCRLREASPAPFAAYFDFGDGIVVSSSPEQFLRVENGLVETRPIKGTRPRGSGPSDDARLAQELMASEKDRAENLMIVDLLRNDLGKVCRVGSIKVQELFALETYSTVFHLVSTVVGELRPSLGTVDLLKASFPGGSVTGCPKIRAMEILDELEPTQRGIYCGALGYLSFAGAMNTSIVIRTIIVKDGQAYLQVGGAIIADSDPEAEYQETLYKAQGAFVALGL